MRWKTALAIVVLGVLTLLAAGYVVLRTMDYNRFKGLIEQTVRDYTGRQLVIGGNIDLSISLVPGLVMTDLMLANAPWGSQPQMVKIDRVYARVKLLPLLLGNVEVKGFALEGTDLFLETNAMGRANWEFTPGADSDKGVWAFTHLGLHQVRVENLTFVFRDGKTGTTWLAVVASFEAARAPAEDSLAVDIKATLDGQPVALSGQTGLIGDVLEGQPFRIDLSGKVVNTTVKVDGEIGDVLNLQGIDLAVQATGTDLSKLGVVINTRLPETDTVDLSGHLSGSAKALALDHAQGTCTRGSLEFKVSGAVGNLTALSDINLQLNASGADLAELSPIMGETLPETGPFTVTGRLKGALAALALESAKGRVSRDGLMLAASGTIKDLNAMGGIDLLIDASGKDLAELGPLIGKELPMLGPFKVGWKLSGSSKVLSFDNISALVDQSDFNGRAQVEFQKRPKITVDLESALLDLTQVMKKLEESKPERKKGSSGERRLFSQKAVPFEVLESVDADIVLKAKNIHARDAQLNFGLLNLKLEDRELSVKLQATYQQTKVSGGLHIKPGSHPRISTKFLVQDFDLGGFLREIHATDKVQSRIDVAAHLSSHGTSPNVLMANLNGSIGAVMGQGQLTTRYLDLIASDISKKVIPFWGRNDDAGRIECALVQFDIKDGLATSQAFFFNTQPAVLSGQGDINLATEKVDFLLDPKPKDPSLFHLGMKLHISGSVMDPKVRPSKGAIAKKGAKLLGTLAVGPMGLLAPFVSLGARQKHPCDIEALYRQIESLAK